MLPYIKQKLFPFINKKKRTNSILNLTTASVDWSQAQQITVDNMKQKNNLRISQSKLTKNWNMKNKSKQDLTAS